MTSPAPSNADTRTAFAVVRHLARADGRTLRNALGALRSAEMAEGANAQRVAVVLAQLLIGELRRQGLNPDTWAAAGLAGHERPQP